MKMKLAFMFLVVVLAAGCHPENSVIKNLPDADSVTVYLAPGYSFPIIERRWIVHNDGRVMLRTDTVKPKKDGEGGDGDRYSCIKVIPEDRAGEISLLIRKIYIRRTGKDIVGTKDFECCTDMPTLYVHIHNPYRQEEYSYYLGYQNVVWSPEFLRLRRLLYEDI